MIHWVPLMRCQKKITRWWLEYIHKALRKASSLSVRGWESKDFPRWVRWRIKLVWLVWTIRHPFRAMRRAITTYRIKRIFRDMPIKE